MAVFFQRAFFTRGGGDFYHFLSGTASLTGTGEYGTVSAMRIITWITLVTCLAGGGLAQRKSLMAPIEDVPGLPRVLLIGDSISIGYTLPVREALKGVANIHRIPTNGGPTSKGLDNIEAWLGTSKWDVIHFNWGLHDLCYRHPKSKTQGNRDKVNGSVTHSVEEYSANLEKLVLRMKKTGARLVFATTTPVPEGEAGRKVGDDLRYNKAALAVMEKHDVAVNDLHALMAGRMARFGTRPGNVHFKPEGSSLLAEKVAKALKEALLAERK
jgi:hypothetical protein